VDSDYLEQALKLAKKGQGRTLPNPIVGAVIVKNGKVLGQGYHREAGLEHAEIEALNAAKVSVRGAALYLNLEPCCHQGKTPACALAIIQSGLSKVVCCTLDPNPKVCGQGVARLRRAGLEVRVGELAAQAEQLNEAFFSYHKQGRPFVAIKFAASLDGKIATRTNDSKWITNQRARDYARQLRGRYQAVLVGSQTVIQDDPHLGLGSPNRLDPLRVVLDNSLKIPLESQVLRDKNVLIITSRRANPAKLKALMRRGMVPFICPGDQIELGLVMKELARREIISLFVEGGGTVLGSFVDAGLVDKVYAFYAPLIIGGQAAIGAVGGQGVATIGQALKLTRLARKNFGDNSLISGYPAKLG